MGRDLHNKIKTVLLFAPVAAQNNSDTAIVSAIIDRLGFESVELVIITGTETDANVTTAVLVEDGDNSALSDNAAVDDAYLLGTELGDAPIFSDDNKTFKIGYTGQKRYVRMTLTPSGNNSGDWFMAGVAILGDPRTLPLSTQKN